MDTLEVQFSEVRETLISLGVDLDANGTIQTPDHPAIPPPPTPRAKQPPSSVDFEDLAIEAGRYLSATGLDPNRNPLLQVLSPTQTSEINRLYKHAFGDIGWDQSDYLAVLLAGFVATLLDVFLVRIPLDGTFLGRMQAGSPMTHWIRENSRSVHGHVVALLYVGVFISGIPSEFVKLQTPCTDAVSCSLIPHLTAQKVQQLKELGLSAEVFAAIELAFTAVSAAIGTLIFWRKSEDRMSFLDSLMLLTFGGAVPIALFTLGLSPSGRQRQERRLLSALHRRSSSSTSSPTGTSCPAGRAALDWRR